MKQNSKRLHELVLCNAIFPVPEFTTETNVAYMSVILVKILVFGELWIILLSVFK